MNLFPADPFAYPEVVAARRRRWQWFFAALAILIITGFAARPIYRWGKGWRGRSLASEAERATTAAQWRKAAEKVQAAVQMAPNEPAVLRAAAHLYTHVGARQAFGYWEALVALPTATAEDRREAAQFGLAEQRYDLSAAQIGILRKEEPVRAENLDLAAQLAWQKGDRAAALPLNDQLLALDPTHPRARLRHGELLSSSVSAVQKAQGIDELVALAQSAAPTALAALETLANEPALSPGQVRAVVAELATHAGGKTEHRLAAFSLRMRLEPARRAELLDRAIEEFRAGEPDALAALCRWLMQRDEAARVVEILPLPVSLTRQNLFLIRLDALSALRHWAEIQRTLRDEKPPIRPFYREVFLARATLELGETRSSKEHWNEALEGAGRDSSLLLYLAQYTEKIGCLSMAEKAWRQLAEQPGWALRASASLVPILEAQGNTRGLRDLMRRLRQLVPNDPAPRHDEAYLDLLLGENISAAQETAAQLLREHPERLAYHSTVALGDLRSGDPAGALREYRGIEFDWQKAPAAAQAVRAAVLFANKDFDAARAAASSISLPALKPEERALVSPIQIQ